MRCRTLSIGLQAQSVTGEVFAPTKLLIVSPLTLLFCMLDYHWICFDRHQQDHLVQPAHHCRRCHRQYHFARGRQCRCSFSHCDIARVCCPKQRAGNPGAQGRCRPCRSCRLDDDALKKCVRFRINWIHVLSSHIHWFASDRERDRDGERERERERV